MTQERSLTPSSEAPRPQPDPLEGAARALTLPLLATVAGILGAVALVCGLASSLQPARTPGPAERAALHQVAPAAQAITPITSLTASCPVQLGGSCSTTGSLYAPDADRVYIRARTGSSTATLNLVEWIPEDGKWTKVGADCGVTTDLTTCRYVGARGARYWHVYKASGTMAYTGIEPVYGGGGASLGTIEPVGSSAPAAHASTHASAGSDPVTLAISQITSLQTTLDGKASSSHTHAASDVVSGTLPTTRGGTGLASYTANCIFYSSSTSAQGQRCCADGEYIKWVSGVPTCATAPAAGFTPVLTKIVSGSGNWSPTSGATMVRAFCVGGGGGGGSGRLGTSDSSSGGGGGGAGGWSEVLIAVADLTTPVAYSIGTAGSGGAARATNTNGATGGSGGTTSFGTYCRGGGGGGGGGGTTTSGTQGTSGTGIWSGTGYGGAGTNTVGGDGDATNPYTLNFSILAPGVGPTGGGAGGGGSTTVTRAGGTGGYRPAYTASSAAAAGGATLGAAGAAGSAGLPAGYGGGGGAGGDLSTNGGAGGSGGNYGAGGGGGGGAVTNGVSTSTSGAGGNGAGGAIWIFESMLLPANDNAEPRRAVA